MLIASSDSEIIAQGQTAMGTFILKKNGVVDFLDDSSTSAMRDLTSLGAKDPDITIISTSH